MWKTLGGAQTVGNKSQKSIKFSPYTPTSIDNVNNQQDQSLRRVTTMTSNSFCHKYFKSIQKKRLDSSRMSAHSRDKSQPNANMEVFRSSRSPRHLKAQANDSMMLIDKSPNQILFKSAAYPKQSESPLRFKQLIKQVQSERLINPFKQSYKLKQVKKRVDKVKVDYKLIKDSIMKQILLFKNQMNKAQAQISQIDFNSKNDKNQIQNMKTECILNPAYSSNNALESINAQIKIYEQSMNNLQKKKQSLIQRIQLNERKLKQ